MTQIQNADLSPVHRVLQADGRRFSLKLEQPFWTTLEEEAKRQGLVLSRFIHQISSELPLESSLTGFLRLYCLEVLRAHNGSTESDVGSTTPSSNKDLSNGQRLSHLISFFISCPSAGLLLGPNQKIISVNPGFEKWSRLRSESIVGKPIDWHFQIRLPIPVSALMARFANGAPQVINARVSYVAPGRIVVANARVSLAYWAKPEDFVWSVMIEAPTAPGSPLGAPKSA